MIVSSADDMLERETELVELAVRPRPQRLGWGDWC